MIGLDIATQGYGGPIIGADLSTHGYISITQASLSFVVDNFNSVIEFLNGSKIIEFLSGSKEIECLDKKKTIDVIGN